MNKTEETEEKIERRLWIKKILLVVLFLLLLVFKYNCYVIIIFIIILSFFIYFGLIVSFCSVTNTNLRRKNKKN